jgi:4-hydroxy-tetrahydrodipicolinate reductase
MRDGGVNLIHPVRHLTKPDDVGTKRGNAAGRARWPVEQGRAPRHPRVACGTPGRSMFAVHVDQPLRPGALVQVIDILRHDQQGPRPVRVQPSQRSMRRIGLNGLHEGTPRVVKAQHEIGVTRKRAGRCDVFDPVILPQAACTPERADAALGADSSAGQDHDIAEFTHLAHEAREQGQGQVMTRMGIIGSAGRMGEAIRVAIAANAALTLSGGIDLGGDPIALAKASDVLIDFSSPRALTENLGAAVAAGTPIVVGTTGLDEDHHQAIDDAAHHVAVLQTGNTSLGVTLLARLVREAAARLGPEWDIEIAEMHHRHKVDAPSGTAMQLGRAAAAGRGIDLDSNSARGRDGITGARPSGTIGFASLRAGSAAGDHTVYFATDDERIELTHRAENRTIFASGALRAALWLKGQVAGRYGMDQVLGM